MVDRTAKTALNDCTATEALGLLRRGSISIRELAHDCAARIAEIEPQVHAWEYYDEDRLLDNARLLEERLAEGHSAGRLCGIPVGVKDIFNTKDMPTCMGSPIWSGFIPGNDARVVSYVRREDGFVAGKTVTAEFAVDSPGKTLNPHNPLHITGTSSSGSAVAVATRMVPLALGTQTAGSCIRPASYNGVFGFKPSFGLVPRTGMLKTLDTLDHVTAFARCVEDLFLFLDVARVRGPDHPFIFRNVDQREQNAPSVYKVAFARTPVWEHAHAYTQAALEEFVHTLDKQDWIHVDEVQMPETFGEVHSTHSLVYNKALSYYFKDECRNHRDQVSPGFLSRVEQGRQTSLEDYRRGLKRQMVLARELDRFLGGYDVLVSLSTAGEAPPLSARGEPPDPCLIWTLCHVPAVNVPLFTGPTGLPFGAQVVARKYDDYSLLQFLRKLELNGIV